MTYEYRCFRPTEADGTEDGWVPVRCGSDAAVVSLMLDEGICLDCLTEIHEAHARPLANLPDPVAVL